MKATRFMGVVYRREIRCSVNGCDKLVCLAGSHSAVVDPDRKPVRYPTQFGFLKLRLDCEAGHANELGVEDVFVELADGVGDKPAILLGIGPAKDIQREGTQTKPLPNVLEKTPLLYGPIPRDQLTHEVIDSEILPLHVVLEHTYKRLLSIAANLHVWETAIPWSNDNPDAYNPHLLALNTGVHGHESFRGNLLTVRPRAFALAKAVDDFRSRLAEIEGENQKMRDRAEQH